MYPCNFWCSLVGQGGHHCWRTTLLSYWMLNSSLLDVFRWSLHKGLNYWWIIGVLLPSCKWFFHFTNPLKWRLRWVDSYSFWSVLPSVIIKLVYMNVQMLNCKNQYANNLILPVIYYQYRLENSMTKLKKLFQTTASNMIV